MSTESGARILVLGGIRSGKSRLARSLVADAASVRYLATGAGTEAAAGPPGDRPDHWVSDDVGADPDRLYALLGDAKPDEAVLVDDLAGWVASYSAGGVPGDDGATLAAAVRDCAAARLVLVSREVGLSVAPAGEPGRAFADRLGALNQAVAGVCDAVALVVAGQPTWLRGGDPRPTATVLAPRATAPAGRAVPAPVAVPAAASAVARPAPAATGNSAAHIRPGMALPMPDEAAGEAARERLERLNLHGSGLGRLAQVVSFAGAAAGTAEPAPWREIRVLLLHADHDGGVAAGDSPDASARRVAAAERGEGALALLAGAAGAGVEVVRCGEPARPIEAGDALTGGEVEAALAYGWQLAEAAADGGGDLVVLAASGAGADAAAVALIAATINDEAAALLGRVFTGAGRVDDAAWMARCAAVRDALYRQRARPRESRGLLAALGGADLAVATGALLGAVSRQVPVLLDGPVGVAAALLARDFGGQVRHWLVLPDDGGHPAVRRAAEVLGLTPLLDLHLGLGEGTGALAALPLLRTALALAAHTPARAGDGDGDGGSSAPTG